MRPNSLYSAFDCQNRDGGEGRPDDYRTPFQVDRDRIIHTSAFRRLQSKTQVFLSGEYDFYRTRLTHSIEVAQIGRSICAWLKHKSDLLGEDHFIDPDLVEAACLAHDIGHPPFGHTGERSLNSLMRNHGGFEGNAQTLRLLTHAIYSKRRKGMNPTRALLDGVLKYKTLYSELDRPEHHFIYDDQSLDLDFVLDGHDFPPELTPGWVRDSSRSIECQIMDWADDTAYSLNDVVDGINAGFITLQKVERWAENQELKENDSKCLEKLLEALRRNRVEGHMGRRIGDFIEACSLRQDANFLSPATRRYQYRLEIDLDLRAESKLYKGLALDIVFRSTQLQQLDKKADFVVRRLFGALAETYITPDRPTKNGFRLLSEDDETAIWACETESQRARLVCDAIARMSDSVASRTYKRLFDPDFGSIVDLVW